MIDHPVHIVPRAASQNVLKVRASSWGNLFDCAYAWEGVHILGYRKPAGLRAQLGTAVHASTAAFDRGRLVGAEPVSAMDAADVLVKELREPERDVDMNQDDLTWHSTRCRSTAAAARSSS